MSNQLVEGFISNVVSIFCSPLGYQKFIFIQAYLAADQKGCLENFQKAEIEKGMRSIIEKILSDEPLKTATTLSNSLNEKEGIPHVKQRLHNPTQTNVATKNQSTQTDPLSSTKEQISVSVSTQTLDTDIPPQLDSAVLIRDDGLGSKVAHQSQWRM